MVEPQTYGFMPDPGAEFPPETMLGETVYDFEGKAVGWIVSPDCAENAKLRELVKALWHLFGKWLLKHGEVPYDELNDAYERTREFGIEVDG